jgi:hypothetical protein
MDQASSGLSSKIKKRNAMFEQIIKGVLWFAVATYSIGTVKTLTLALGAVGSEPTGYVLLKEEGRKPLIYPAIEGTDVAMPFVVPMQTSSRVVGASKLYYAVYPGVPVRNTRYRSFWR